MKPLISAALLMFAALSWGAPEQPAGASAKSETSQNKPAQQLIALERQLFEKQESRDKGTLPPDQYQAFVGRFRVELESAMSAIPPTPANKGLHAQLLSRLGTEERQAAIIGLTQALETSPDDPELLRAQAQISYESGDFPAAAEAAKRAWESSGQKDKAAWGLLKMSEGRVAATGNSSPSPMKAASASQPTTLDWTIPKNNDISPKAMGFIRSAIAARGRGDMAATWSNAQAAMNTDPTSTAVQSFYSVVQGERTQRQETQAFIQKAVAAMGAGNGEEAVAWARKAYERSPGDDTKAILEDVQRRSAGLKTSTPDQAPARKGGMPLLPLMAAGAGLTALGLYKVALSRGTSSSVEGLNPSPDVSPEQARRNYVNSAIVIGTPIVIAALVYGGPLAWRAIAPTATTALRGTQQSIQRVATSEAGALTTGASSRVPGFTAQESLIIDEARQILASPQFKQLQDAYNKGSPVVVRIGGRVVQYEPEMPSAYSGMALFKENGFVLGRTAFKSTLELQKTVLHELHRLSTTQSSNGVNAALASRETDAAYSFAERAAGAINR
jgi:tetratricopeptide (TPR) repeat protein